MRSFTRWTLFGTTLLTAGCSAGSPSAGGDASDTTSSGGLPACMEVSSGPLSPTDATPGGFTPADVLALVQGTHHARLTWGATSDIPELTVTPTGSTELAVDVTPVAGGIEYAQWREPDGGTAGCPESGLLTIQATVVLRTIDGGLNETLSVALQASSTQSASFSAAIAAGHVVGSFRVQDTMTWDTTSMTVSGTFTSDGVRGEVTYSASSTMATGANTATGIGLMVPVATWVPEMGDAGSGQTVAEGGGASE